MKEASKNNYYRPEAPRNALEALRWYFFEPHLLRDSEYYLSQKESDILFLNTYVFLAAIGTLVWVILYLIIILIQSVDNQSYLLLFDFDFDSFIGSIDFWKNFNSFFDKGLYILFDIAFIFVNVLGYGWVFGLSFCSTFGFSKGLIGGLGFGLAFGTIFGILLLNNFDDRFLLRYIITFGLTFGLFFGTAFGLVTVLITGIIFSIVFGVVGGLYVGISVGLAFLFGYIHLLHYPFIIIKTILPFNNLYESSYVIDARIFIPIPKVKKQVVKSIFSDPNLAPPFIQFLYEYRPFYKEKAMYFEHAYVAAIMTQKPLNDTINLLVINNEQNLYQPSVKWIQLISNIQQELKAANLQTGIRYKKEIYTRVKELLEVFQKQNFYESNKWNHLYFSSIKLWQAKTNNTILEIEEKLKNKEKISPQIYFVGNPLTTKFKDIFLGRDDLQERLSYKILTAKEFPTLLLQGQRRVGKTSLLNFLPSLLPSRIIAIQQDLQKGNIADDVVSWLSDLYQNINNTLKEKYLIKELPEWLPSSDWMDVWKEFSFRLNKITQDKKFKLLLSIDEYEELHYRAFRKKPYEAGKLLGAIRSYMQSQQNVVFMFAGSAYFSELTKPNWIEYLVNIELLHCDYLNKENTIALIQKAQHIKYEEGMPEKIFNLTQGLPDLTQRICKGLVEYANRKNNSIVTQRELNIILNENIMIPQNGVIEVFWNGFCGIEADSPEKMTVRQILKNETITNKIVLKRLLNHKYVIKKDNIYQMRVPLFTEWIKKNDASFL